MDFARLMEALDRINSTTKAGFSLLELYGHDVYYSIMYKGQPLAHYYSEYYPLPQRAGRVYFDNLSEVVSSFGCDVIKVFEEYKILVF